MAKINSLRFCEHCMCTNRDTPVRSLRRDTASRISSRQVVIPHINTNTTCFSSSSTSSSDQSRPMSVLSPSPLSVSSTWWSPLQLLLCWLLLLSVVVRCQGLDMAGQTRTEMETADKYLSTFGYYPRHQGYRQAQDDASPIAGPEWDVTSKHTDVERSQAIKRLQTFFHLPATGHLDPGTTRVMKVTRCGREDVTDEGGLTEGSRQGSGPAGTERVKRYALNRYSDGTVARWNVSQLTWKITRPSRQLSELQQREVIRKSLAMWAQYVPIRFVEDTSQTHPDIDIQFARGEHGAYPDRIFDGSPEQSLNVLAHAWGPGYKVKGLAGDVHFDEDDNWTDYNTFLGVAVHELGHSMGLLHSNDESAIMYPVYRSVVALAPDDIAGIKEMYASGTGTDTRSRTQAPPVWTYRPEIRYSTQRPDPRYRTERPDPRYRTERPDPRYRTERPDPRHRTERPDPRYRTESTDPRYRTERPDYRYRTERPDPRYRTERPYYRYRTERPDPRYRTERPDPRYRSERPDPRYRTERPDYSYRTRPTLKPVYPPSTQLPVDVCATVNVDAVFEDPSTLLGRRYLAVSDGRVHTLTQHGLWVKSESLQDTYPGVPTSPDVAFSLYKKRTVYFIKDDTMWAYKDGQLEAGYPRSLRSLRFPERPRFTVTLNQRDANPRLLLFGDRYWWTFDVDRSFTAQYQPISSFSGDLPQGLTFAAQWIDNYLYAVTQDSYVIMDLEKRRVIHHNPIPGKPEWMQVLCGQASRASLISLTTLVVAVSLTSLMKSLL